MEISRYVLRIPLRRNGEKEIIFSTLTRKMAITRKDDTNKLFSGDFKAFSDGYLNKLKESGIIREAPVDELELVEYYLNQTKFQNVAQITIILTTYCNLACIYCYERTLQLKERKMDLKTAKKTIDFLKQLVKTKSISHLSLEFYGGEPFLEYPLMKFIARQLHKFCQNRRVKFNFGIMTNGTTIPENSVTELIEIGLKRIQISLDGPPEIHDKRRPTKLGEPTFKAILKNIKQVSQLMPVNVRVNIDWENEKSIAELFSIFCKHGLKNRINIYFVPVIPERDQYFKKDRKSMSSINWEEIIQIGSKSGIRNTMSYYATGPCHFSSDNSFAIDPRGYLYKCLPLPETKVGHVTSPILNQRHIESIESNPWKYSDECLQCVYLPLCFGGCRYKAFVNSGDYGAIFCEKAIFEKMGNKLIQLRGELIEK
ncbi:MAG: radical SAM protein [Methanophagales archaeon]|nr:radical SAM protein [Methanophagales archaeon]